VDEALSGIFFIRYQHHYVFSRELSGGTLGVISVLHENMDIPTNRLREDSERGEND
jgi:plasmid stabilization system protein ParE